MKNSKFLIVIPCITQQFFFLIIIHNLQHEHKQKLLSFPLLFTVKRNKRENESPLEGGGKARDKQAKKFSSPIKNENGNKERDAWEKKCNFMHPFVRHFSFSKGKSLKLKLIFQVVEEICVISKEVEGYKRMKMGQGMETLG